MSNHTHTQERGICVFCGKEHATRNGRMVQHGYQVEGGEFVDSCSGVNQVHLGHEKAPALLQHLIEHTQTSASGVTHNLANLSEQIRELQEKQQRLIRYRNLLLQAIADMEQRHENWQPQDTRTVNVEQLTAEKKQANAAKAAAKKKDALVAAEQKAQRAAERKAKSDKKVADYLALTDFVIADGKEEVVHWQAVYESADEYRTDVTNRIQAYRDKVLSEYTEGTMEYHTRLQNMFFSITVYGRTKPEGKGRKVEEPNAL